MHSLDGPVLCHAFSRATGPLPDAGPPWAPPANSAACAPRACAACLAPLRTVSATAFHRHRCQRRSSATRGSAGDAANAVGDHALAVDLRWRGGGDCQQQPAHSHHDERARVGSLGSFDTEQAGTDVDAASHGQSAVLRRSQANGFVHSACFSVGSSTRACEWPMWMGCTRPHS